MHGPQLLYLLNVENEKKMDARTIMVAQVEMELNGLLVEKDSLSPTIKFQFIKVEECKSNLEATVGYKVGMKKVIDKIRDFTFHVV
jgi:hypothetical protein